MPCQQSSASKGLRRRLPRNATKDEKKETLAHLNHRLVNHLISGGVIERAVENILLLSVLDALTWRVLRGISPSKNKNIRQQLSQN
jgi:hypothetical protein